MAKNSGKINFSREWEKGDGGRSDQGRAAVAVGFIRIEASPEKLVHQAVVSSNGGEGQSGRQLQPAPGQHVLRLPQNILHERVRLRPQVLKEHRRRPLITSSRRSG